MKFKPETHIIGKVYDLTQENMNATIHAFESLQSEVIDYNRMLQDINRLELSLKETKRLKQEWETAAKEDLVEIEKLRAENARLREALCKIADGETRCITDVPTDMESCCDVARAALSEGKG